MVAAEPAMADLFWLTPKQMKRIERYFPLPHGVPRVWPAPLEVIHPH